MIQEAIDAADTKIELNTEAAKNQQQLNILLSKIIL